MTDPRLLEPRELEALLLVDLPERPEWREGWQMLLDHIMAQQETIEDQAKQIAKHDREIQSWKLAEDDWRTTKKNYYERIIKLRSTIAPVITVDALDIAGLRVRSAAWEVLKMAYEEDGHYG